MEQRIFAAQGYYVACCAREVGPGTFVGHARICVDRPEDYDSAKALEKLASIGTYPDAERALKAAEFQARQVIESLQPNWAPFTAPGSMSRR